MDKRDIYQYLSQLPDVVQQNSVQLRTRCFLCGDSMKNPNKKRLGIKIDWNDPDEPIVYNCFNCFEQGIFSPNMLRRMGIDDPAIESALRQINHSAVNDDGTKVSRYKNNKEIELKIPPLTNSPQSISKYKYLVNRLGCKIPIEDFDSLKIIWNLGDLLSLNNIKPNNKFVSLLDRDYIGFLSVNNEYVILRDITNKNTMRYVKYNIFNVYDNTNGFYAMRSSLDLLQQDPIKIVVAEGTFDILSARYNIYDNNTDNTIYVAVCNGSFSNAILYFIRKGIVGRNVSIECYQDNDTRMNFKKLRAELKPYIINNSNMTVYYNTLSKDIGVHKDQISIDRVTL